jgi:hypothetical protein
MGTLDVVQRQRVAQRERQAQLQQQAADRLARRKDSDVRCRHLWELIRLLLTDACVSLEQRVNRCHALLGDWQRFHCPHGSAVASTGTGAGHPPSALAPIVPSAACGTATHAGSMTGRQTNAAAVTATVTAMQAGMTGTAAPATAAAGKPGTTEIVQDRQGMCAC